MRGMNGRIRAGGTWLAIASFLIILTLLLHGPISTDLAEQMRRVSEHSMTWAVAHWIAAAAFSFYAMAGLLVLSSDSSRIAGWATTSAWAVIPVAALWTLTTAIAEATVVASAAQSGDQDVFNAWWAFAEGKATGFAFMALAVATIAASEARSAAPATPAWAAWAATVAGVASFSGWVLGMWLGIAPGNLLGLVSSILMSAWTGWFGIALARSPEGAPAMAEV